jgi:hypothetical protein
MTAAREVQRSANKVYCLESRSPPGQGATVLVRAIVLELPG